MTQALILKAGKIIGDRFCKVHLLKTGIGVGVRKYLNLSSTNFEYYAVECEEMTQGMIFLETDFHKSRNGKNLAYVDFLAIAPWNRQEIARNPKYRGTGSLLMYLAVSRSEQLGYKYRTGLHSLPAARTFYGKLGMRDLGPDPNYQNLHYFEFDEGTGKAFIRR
ncbi:MAG TPA: hypothetical protein VI636_17640 [Candidatus Angelobacter sp.]